MRFEVQISIKKEKMLTLKKAATLSLSRFLQKRLIGNEKSPEKEERTGGGVEEFLTTQSSLSLFAF